MRNDCVTTTDHVLGHHQKKQNDEKELPKRLKYFTAAAIFYGNTSLGCAVNTYGPAITTMQNKYETNDATISTAFSILTGCSMVGALAGGFIYNYVNRQLAVAIVFTVMAAMVFITPYCPTISTFFASVAVLGFCSGAYGTAQFVWVMEMMQKDCPPFVQCQHFFYAVGANMVTFIIAPFLDHNSHHGKEKLFLNDTDAFLDDNFDKAEVVEDASKLIIPFSVVGILVSIAAIAQMLLFTFMRYYPPPREVIMEEVTEEVTEVKDTGNKLLESFKIGSWSLAKVRIVLLCVIFYAAYPAMETSMFQFFPKFGQNSDLKLSESDSSYTLAGMTAAFAIGRGIAIVAVFKISTQLILCWNLAFLAIANGLLFMWAGSNLPLLWVAAIVFGLGLSSVYASFSAWIERSLRFTNFIGSIMLVGGSGIGAVYPMIIGSYIEDDPNILSYTTFSSIVVLIVTFGALSYITHKNKTRY